MSTTKKTKRHRRKEKQHRTKKRWEIFYSLGVSAIFIAGIIFLTYMILPQSRYSKIITQAGEWMLTRQEVDGHFGYEYNPWENTESADDNLVRQAGATYILSEIFSYYDDGKYLTATAKGLDYLLTKTQTDENGISYILDENNYAKTGAVALGLIACQNIQGTAVWNDNLAQTCTGYEKFLEMIANNSNGFADKYFPKEKVYGDDSSYAGGEAWLALIITYKNNPSDELATILQKKFAFFTQHYRAQIEQEKNGEDASKDIIGFYLWGMHALNQLDQIEAKPEYTEFAYEYTHYVIDAKKLADYKYQNEAKLNNSYAFEGIISTYAMAVRHGDKEEIEYLRPIIEKNLERLKAFQISAKSIGSVMKNNRATRTNLIEPEKAQGGFLNSLQTDEQLMRIDYTQHSVGAYLLAEKYL